MVYLPFLLSMCYIVRDRTANGHITIPRVPDTEERDREARNQVIDAQEEEDQKGIDELTTLTPPQKIQPGTTYDNKLNRFGQNLAKHQQDLYKDAINGIT